MNSVDVIRIVDDDPSITDALSFLLEGEGWNTIAYHDADTFLANDDLKVPGCLILDVRMPNSMSGLELQEQLMSIASYLPIIFISATVILKWPFIPSRTEPAIFFRNLWIKINF